MAPRYLIIGASGFVGRRLLSVLGPANAVATYHRNSGGVEGGVLFDAARMRLADSVLKARHGFTHAFILHGINGIDRCAADPQGTARVNVAGTQLIVDDLVAHGIFPVYASSDAVFDGSRGLWAEDDPVDPILTYGRQKVEVERYLAGLTKKMLILRLSKVIETGPGDHSMLDDWPRKLEAGETIVCARDQVLSPVGIDDAVGAFVELAKGDHTGIFHVCGPEPIARLDFLQMFADELSRYRDIKPRIVSRSLSELTQALSWKEPRPLDASMSPRKLYAALGRSFDGPRELCRKAAAARAGRARSH